MQAYNTFQPIEIYISGRNLVDKDIWSKSDPYVKVSYRRDFNCKSYTFLGKTQTVNNNLNPNFATTITLDYIFESRQDIKFEVFDDDGNKDKDDYLGMVQTTVGALMGAQHQTSILHLTNDGKKKGSLIVRCQKISTSNQYYQFNFRAEKLMNTDSFFDFWDKSDPYLKLLKRRQDNNYLQACRTQVVPNNLNPAWRPLTIQACRIHDQNNTKFKVQCYDEQKNGKDQFIGEAYIDVSTFKTNQSSFPLVIQLQNNKNKKPGKLILERFNCVSKPTFVDYLKGGLQLNMVIAIDFTGSNGDPRQPNSLHYMNPNNLNQYQMAINAVAQILLNYDSDKKIPALGFGAELKFPTMKGLNHCFPLSGDWENVDSCGLPHLMQLYQQSLSNLQLSGPTYFSPVIRQLAKISQACLQRQALIYQTLLIITDGQINDKREAIDLIFDIVKLPLSIIIVGVGTSKFESMNELDGDNGLYNSKGQKVPRDIVQFVPFRDCQYNPDLLAKNLLAELPSQVVQYYQMRGIKPPPPLPTVSMDQMLMSQQQNNGGFNGLAQLINQAYTHGSQNNANNQNNNQNTSNNDTNPYGNIE